MSWKKADSISHVTANRLNVGAQITAGLVLLEFKKICPVTCIPISLRNGVLKVGIERKNQLEFLAIQGKILEEIQEIAKEKKLPPVAKIVITTHCQNE